MIYKVNFIIGLIVDMFANGVGPVFQYLLFTQTKGYPGWTLEQIILFQGMLLFVFGIKNCLFSGIKENIMSWVRTGEFDRVLLKPYPPIAMLFARGFNINRIGNIIGGAILITAMAYRLQLSISPGIILLGIMSIVVCLLFLISVDIMFCTLSITILQLRRFSEFVDSLLRFSHFPLEIFPRLLQMIFIFIIPFAALIYVPVQTLLKRLPLYMYSSFIIVFIWFGINIIFWNKNLKNYSSAGG
jgi:ABC-2 type transport system permease protein